MVHISRRLTSARKPLRWLLVTAMMSNALINGSWQLNNLISMLFCMHVQTFHSEPTMFPLHQAHELETFELHSLSVYRFIQKTKDFFYCVADWSSPAKYICALIVTRGFSCCAVSSAMYFFLFILTFCSLLQQWIRLSDGRLFQIRTSGAVWRQIFALSFITKAAFAGGNMCKVRGSCVCRYPCLQCMIEQQSVLAKSYDACMAHWQFWIQRESNVGT